MMARCILNLKNNVLLFTLLFVYLFVCCYYNILYDILLIFFLFLGSYGVGCVLEIKGTLFEKIVIRTAAGMGIFGIAIYYILFLGIGNKSIYIFMLLLSGTVILPFKKKRNELMEAAGIIKDIMMQRWLLTAFIFIGLVVYTIYGCAPISSYDTLTKHLPVTVYATQNGRWYTDVTEAIVYGEPMVLQYTYCVLFYALGAYKALILFNVILFFAIYIILCYFMHKIYSISSLEVLAVILFTTPFFFQYSTIFYLEILPIYFLFSAFVGMGKLEKEKIWNNIEIIAFLCGCSLFVKLTSVFTILVMATVLLGYCIIYAVENKIILQLVRKILLCIFSAIIPSVASLCNIWYKTGNPFFPSYNGIFKSPYFMTSNFEDPFTNKLTFSISSLIDIVFHTSQNIEMPPFGLGIFLLFIFVIPIAILVLILQKKMRESFSYIIWSLVTIIAYMANTLTTFNLRYYFSVWILSACVITSGMSICLSFAPKQLRNVVLVLIGTILFIPNFVCLRDNGIVLKKFVKDERIVDNEFCEILANIPTGKKVLSVTGRNQFKGQYEGYFASTSWHNSTLDKILEGVYEWGDYLSSFDYILIDKTIEESYLVKIELNEILPAFLGEQCFENNACILYKAIPRKDIIVDSEFVTPKETCVTEPITEYLSNDKTEYYIRHQVMNESDHPITMRYQINWMSEEGETIDVYIMTYNAHPGEGEYYSEKIPANKEADYAMVYIVTADEQKVKIGGYTVEGINNVVENEAEKYKDRTLLSMQR